MSPCTSGAASTTPGIRRIAAINPPGFLIWIPVFQIFPLLRAADMSPWWFLGFFVPVFNLLAQILLSFKIVQARGKNAWVGVLLLLPLTNVIAVMYLAFSGGRPADSEDEERRVEIMTLETA